MCCEGDECEIDDDDVEDWVVRVFYCGCGDGMCGGVCVRVGVV